MHDNTLTQENRDKFIWLAEWYSQIVKFYNVEELCADKIAEIRKCFPQIDKNYLSIGMFYRIFIPFVLPESVDKAIYFDGDIIVNLDISELWQFELDDKILGVVSEDMLGDDPRRKIICIDGYVKAEDYFNSGVLLMNLSLLRGEWETLLNGMKFIQENPRYAQWLDQTLLNYCFSTRTVKLPIKFNRMLHVRRNQETSIERKIYHYATSSTLGLNQSDILNKLWMSYFVKAPWFDADAIGRFYTEILKMRDNLLTSAANLSAVVSGKTRAFFVEPAKVDAMKKFFSIRDDELIIPAENQDSIQRLIGAMKASQGKCVFFIMTEKFLNKNFPFELLTNEGFALGKNFLRGWEYLSEAHGNRLNSYYLIQAM